MKRHFVFGLAAAVGLFVAGCGGGSGTNIAFELEGHHYDYTHAYYSVLGGVVVDGSATTYTLEFSALDCATIPRAVGDDLDVQLFASLTSPPYPVKIESPDPAANDTFLEGSGEVNMDVAPPQLTSTAGIAALNVTLTGTVDFLITGGTQSVVVTGPFSATHCGRMDSAQ